MPPNTTNFTPIGPPSQLSARYRSALMAYFMRRNRSRSEAEDLTQEVLVRTLAAAELNDLKSPDGYIFTIAANLLRDEKRQATRNGTPVYIPIDEALSGELERQLVEDCSPERVLLNIESVNDALQTLSELGELTRNIFILFRLEAMKQKDIAMLYGIGQSTVEKHVMKAVVHLMNRYGRNRE